MPEREFEDQIREIEATEQFRLLKASGVLSIHPFAGARLATRHFGGRDLIASSSALTEVLDGRGSLARLLERVGQERFEECFLQDNPLSDEERARSCGISKEDVRKLREMVDRLYVQAEFDDSSRISAPAKAYSVVAGIQLEDGRPVLSFFNRDIWKGRYEIDPHKQAALVAALPSGQVQDIDRLISRLDFIERRKSTLYRALETLIDLQADYLLTGAPERRRPLTQRKIAAQLGVAPSVLNSLVSNKAIQLPWGLESPMKVLMPSAKSLLLSRLFDLAMDKPELSDESLGSELNRLYGAHVSRRSVAHYRSNLRIGGSGCRAAAQAQLG